MVSQPIPAAAAPGGTPPEGPGRARVLPRRGGERLPTLKAALETGAGTWADLLS